MIRRLALHVSAFLLVFILLVLSTAGALLLPPYRSADRIWKGYYTLLLEEDIDTSSLAELKPVARDAEIAVLSDFEEPRTLPLTEIFDSHDRDDPRLDPYLRGLEGYFTGGPRESTAPGGPGSSAAGFEGEARQRVFVASRLPLLPFLAGLKPLLPRCGKDWRIADADFLALGLVLTLSAAFLAALLFLRKWRPANVWLIAAYVPWLPVLALGGYVDLFSFFLLFSGWVLLFEGGRGHLVQFLLYRWREPGLGGLKSRMCYLGAAIVVCGVIRIPMDDPLREIGFLLFPLAADLCVFFLAGLSRVFASRTITFHPVYVPLGLRMKRPTRGVRRRFVLLTALPVLLAPFLSQLKPPVAVTPIPVAVPLPGREAVDWSGLTALRDVEGELPDLSDFLAHISYQTWLAYGMEYRLPARNETLDIPVFTEDPADGRIEKSLRTLVSFDDRWLNDQLSLPKIGSIPRMLLDQGEAVSVRFGPWRGSTPVVAWWKSLGLLFYGFFLILCFDFLVAPVICYSSKFQLFRKIRRAA